MEDQDKNNFFCRILRNAQFYNLKQDQSLIANATPPALAGQTASYKSDIDYTSLAPIVGISFQFMTWDFRWSPFIQLTYLLNEGDPDTTFVNQTTGATITNTSGSSQAHGSEIIPSGGISFTYVPWNINFMYTPNIVGIFDEKADIRLLTLSKIFVLD